MESADGLQFVCLGTSVHDRSITDGDIETIDTWKNNRPMIDLCIALLCFAWLCFALHGFACFALLCFALLCLALLCFAMLSFALLCFA